MNAPEETDRDRALPTEDRKALAALVMQLLEHWQVIDADRAGLLGLPANDNDAMGRFRSGEMIGVEPDVEERVGLQPSIHSLLRSLFPQDRVLAYR